MIDDPLSRDFRKFLYVVWKFLGLPDPTPLQYDIARYMQHGPSKECIEAFRGVGKSFVAAAFALWCLRNDPQFKIMVVSASKSRADAFSTFCMRLIQEMEILAHLRPKDGQRNSRIEFDVGPAIADQSPSLKSVGITGQLTGSRADLIIADDVEVLNNSATADMREKLLELTKEFSAILKPLPHARIIYLGTPQTEDSIYNKLPETFETQIWPARIPTKEEAEKYGDKLAPYIQKLMARQLPGTTTDPDRFTDADLLNRETEYGRAGFALQFMLNTQLSDEDRFPLKVKDLIIMDIDKATAPMKVNWLPDDKRNLKELPNLAMAGDKFYACAAHDQTFSPFTSSVMAIDPSGRGKDETGYAVVKMLNGFLYVTRAGGLPGGYDNATLQKLAMIAKEEMVNQIVIEANFGDGMYTKLFEPVISKIHPCVVEEVKHSQQKERRIIDTLEPVMNRHRLILDKQIITDDYRTAQAYEADNRFTKTLIYQMTRISYERGSLKHDDRLDALAIAVAFHTDAMAQDAERGIAHEKQARLDKELEKFMEGVHGRRHQMDTGSHRFASGMAGARYL
ncbi:phage terminase large subunit [Bradyrhizobium sp. SZCCHNRI2049]|uniref:phage terminase large subunit n=1 Tax=Bradyrhizobium sp. SZCCHNRI2049 TaxID=3057287 RepID=UPI00291641B1|nr:phage terminase large subunit [Bradyrhizobium sp. SZCCHNRI2049]